MNVKHADELKEKLASALINCDGTPESKAEVYKSAVEYYTFILENVKNIKSPDESILNYFYVVKIAVIIKKLALNNGFTEFEWLDNVEMPVLKNGIKKLNEFIGKH